MTDIEALRARVLGIEAALQLMAGVLYKLVEQARAAHLTRAELDEMKAEVDRAVAKLPAP